MRKTYKPIDRKDRASQMYRRKTLNVNDALNIQHDEDDIENVDAYWDTAVSVIGNSTIDALDDTVNTEQTDTLFNIKNIRQSIRSKNPDRKLKYPKEEGKANILAKNTKLKAQKKLTLNPYDNDSDDLIDISALEAEEKMKENTSNLKKDVNEGKKRQNTQHESKAKEEESSKNETLPNIAGNENNIGLSFDNYEPNISINSDANISYSETNEKQTKTKNNIKLSGNKEPMLKAMKQGAAKKMKRSIERSEDGNDSRSSNTDSVISTRKNKKSKKSLDDSRIKGSLLIENVKDSVMLNKVKPVVCSQSINTATIDFDYLAYIKNEKAENAFSIFVVRGNVEISTGTSSRMIKRGEVTVIEAGMVYSMQCLSKQGAVLFLTYVL
ncbi:hypothetical protein ENBRE01_0945 [Enteropsectra breve]|nr:hypothetical protein ENBRE01_0945 [Enteropsectra breve]